MLNSHSYYLYHLSLYTGPRGGLEPIPGGLWTVGEKRITQRDKVQAEHASSMHIDLWWESNPDPEDPLHCLYRFPQKDKYVSTPKS